ncbi:MAG: DUF2034 domain-containing protein [Phycisphaerales bacterium]|nr:DUF2034 domain-containing protein [Phycisphaerales bacterium]
MLNWIQTMPRRRKDEGFFDELYEMLLVVPSWVGPPLAGVFYLVLRFIIPAIFRGGEKPDINSILAGVSKGAALPVAGLVLFLWLIAEFRKWQRRGLLDAQSGLESIRALSWQEFEHLVGEAYRRQGYVVQETGSASGDGGIDLSLRKSGERVLVQCKQWKTRRVGVKPVRELFGVMTSESANRSILVTCGSFTREARSFADGKPIDLVEGPELWELVKSVKAASTASAPNRPSTSVHPKPSPPTASTSPSTEAPPHCPKCQAPMVLREAKKGQNAGSRFWGCSRFPQCRGTQAPTQ